MLKQRAKCVTVCGVRWQLVLRFWLCRVLVCTVKCGLTDSPIPRGCMELLYRVHEGWQVVKSGPQDAPGSTCLAPQMLFTYTDQGSTVSFNAPAERVYNPLARL